MNLSKENRLNFLRLRGRCSDHSRSMLMRAGGGSEGKFGLSQEHNTGRGKSVTKESHFPHRENPAPGSYFLVINHPLINLFTR